MPESPTKPRSLNSEERRTLLRLARRRILLAARGARDAQRRAAAGLALDSHALQERRACFVSLHAAGDLRGCIGTLGFHMPLWLAVSENAEAAALRDPRFEPVGEEEVPALEIEISALTPPAPIRPEDVVIGRHGLFIEKRGLRGVFLPQVPVEWGWNLEEYLRQLCRKAGLDRDEWKTASLSAFEAEVFSERDFPGLEREEPPPED